MVTKDDIRDVRDSVIDYMREGFDGVHKRQDITNGRINDAEQDIAMLKERTLNLDKKVSERPAYQKTTTVVVDENERPALTARELKLLLAVGGGAVALIEIIQRYWPLIQAAAQGGRP